MEDKEYTTYQKMAIWEIIHELRICPNCYEFHTMLKGPKGGEAINVKCKKCGQKFFIAAFRGGGAYPIFETKEVITK